MISPIKIVHDPLPGAVIGFALSFPGRVLYWPTQSPGTACDRGGRRCSGGFTLLEVLIAVVVLSLALLGLAALQIHAKKAAFEAVQHSLAAAIAHQVLERMRLNPTALGAYLGTIDTATRYDGVMDCATTVCTADQIALYDRRDFQAQLGGSAESRNSQDVGGLADPRLCIAGPEGGASGSYTVTLVWRGREDLAQGGENASDPCGAGRYGENDRYRRIFRISTYICRETGGRCA
jgi:type IV pilus assembly protein PilV